MDTSAVRGSIVIAAHNEQETIAACLKPLYAGLMAQQYQLVVVSNGCTDDTAERARSSLAGLADAHVVDLPRASKTAALRRGDEELSEFPRVYLDADIRVDAASLDELLVALAGASGPQVAAPRLRMNTSGSSRLVQAYYRVWIKLPYIAGGVIGVGLYAVNEAGKERIGIFPDLLNDDEWVRCQFRAGERLITDGEFVANAAHDIRSLVRQRARVELGNQQIRAELALEEGVTRINDLVALVRHRTIGLADAVVFVSVVAATRLLAAGRRRRGTTNQWSMDMSSRRAGSSASSERRR